MINIFKQSGETKTVSVDFSTVLAAGETITGGSVTVTGTEIVTGNTPSPTVVNAGSVSLSGDIVSFRVENGADTVAYKITVNTGATNLLNKHEEDIILIVNDDLSILYTVDELKRSLSITDTSKDILLFDLIQAATDYMEKATSRAFVFKTYVEDFQPEEKVKTVVLSHFPVSSVSSVVVDGTTVDAVTGTLDNYIVGNEGSVERVDGGMFPKRPYKSTITYKAGFDYVPEDVRNSVRKIVTGEYVKRQKQGISSEQIGSYRVSFRDLDADQGVMVADTISRYKKRVF